MPFSLHFTEAEARARLANIPDALLRKLQLGAASAGFQAEGGFNGPGQPRNNWGAWEQRPDIAASGGAAGFWDKHGEDAALLGKLHLTPFRMSLEWARLRPSFADARAPQPEVDPAAVEGYADILKNLHGAGVAVMPTLYHWTHPACLGPDLWLRDEAPALFAAHLRGALPLLLRALEKCGVTPPTHYITINEPNMYSLVTYVAGRFPHGAGQQGWKLGRRCIETLLLAHFTAAEVVRDVYAEHGLPAPQLSFNNNFSAFYRADLFFADLMHAPQQGVKRNELEKFLRSREDHFTREFLASEEELPLPRQIIRAAVRGLEGLLRTGISAEALPRLVEASYRAEGQAVDFLAFDYYDPFPWNIVGSSTPGNGRGSGPVVDEWDWKPHPKGLGLALQLYAQAAPGRPVWIAENGMATRGVGPKSYERKDGARRDLFIQAHLYELLGALEAGVPVEGYLHWSLWDNYEWGSYQPRFGLLGVDAVGGQVDRNGRDAAGRETLMLYGELATALHALDRDALARVLARP